jgi:hypothetical protein
VDEAPAVGPEATEPTPPGMSPVFSVSMMVGKELAVWVCEAEEVGVGAARTRLAAARAANIMRFIMVCGVWWWELRVQPVCQRRGCWMDARMRRCLLFLRAVQP